MLARSSLRRATLLSALSMLALALGCEDSFSVAFEPRTEEGLGGAAGEGGSPSDGTGGKASGGSGGKEAGGAAGSESQPPLVRELVLADDTLPDASFNAEYEHALEVTNAEGAAAFSLLSGELPRGLELSEDGRISGIPTESGTFTFEVSVTDEEDGILEVELTLEVTRKRWLAYVTQETEGARVYMSDITKADPAGTLVSKDIQSFTNVPLMKFAPNGSALAYTADKSVDFEMGLYWVDASGETPLGDDLISGTARVSSFGWSDTSRYLAFTDNQGAGKAKTYVIDFEGDKKPREVGLGSFVLWVGKTLVSFHYDPVDGESSLRYVTVDDGQFSVVRELTGIDSEVSVVDVATQRVAMKTRGSGDYCTEAASSVVDFAAGTLVPGPAGATRYSPDLSFVARSTGTAFSLFAAATWDSTKAVATGDGPGCEGIWSPDSKWFVFVGADDRATVLSSAGGVTQVLPPTMLSWPSWKPGGLSPQGHSHAGFSPDGRWFRFRGNARTHLSRVTSTGFSVPVQLESGDNTSITSWISPNSKQYVHWEGLTGKANAFRLFDISGEEVQGGRVIASSPADKGAGLDRGSVYPAPLPLFSADSSTFAYRSQALTAEASELYVVDLLEEAALGRKVSACGASTCSVQLAVFQ